MSKNQPSSIARIPISFLKAIIIGCTKYHWQRAQSVNFCQVWKRDKADILASQVKEILAIIPTTFFVLTAVTTRARIIATNLWSVSHDGELRATAA
ncbi:MAG: hypothetical protein ACJAS1_000878 [Oleiphilaceae bacterium]|jgi:hypothetical protein